MAAAQTAESVTLPRGQWRQFFDNFSKGRLGLIVNVEAKPAGGQQHELAKNIPLMGITSSLNEEGVRDEIILLLGRSPGQNMTHAIYDPSAVRVSETGESGLGNGESGRIEIDGAGGEQAVVSWQGDRRG
jgi:hypothetical protein